MLTYEESRKVRELEEKARTFAYDRYPWQVVVAAESWKSGYKRASREAEIKNKKLIREAHRAAIKSNEQLAEAREIIMRFVWASSYFNGKETDLIEEAEQFLKESEK